MGRNYVSDMFYLFHSNDYFLFNKNKIKEIWKGIKQLVATNIQT